MPRVILSAEPVGTLKHYAGGTVPSAYLLCNGAAINRTTYAALFAVIGTTYGTGDGSTTFNLPDFQGRMPMGTGVGSYTNPGADNPSISTRTLGQKVGAETHQIGTANIPAHTHDISHTHAASTVSGTITSNTTSMNHSHGVSDPGHAHQVLRDSGGTFGIVGSPTYGCTDPASSSSSTTGISINGSGDIVHSHNFTNGSAAGQTLSGVSSGNGSFSNNGMNHMNPALVVTFMIRY